MGNAAKTLQDGDSNNKPFRGFGYFFRAPLPVHGPTARRRPWVGRPWPPTVYCTQYSGGRRRTSGTRKRWIHCFSCPSMYRLCIRAPRSPISTKCPPRSRRAPGNPLSPGFISRLGDGDARNRNGLFNGTCTKLMTGSSGCGRRVARDRILVDLWGPLCKLNIELALWKVPCRNRPNRTVRSLGKLHSREGARKASIGKEPDTEQVQWHRRAPKLQGG
jgi:hypothetical protein